jgi:hypothetical protein
MSQKSQSRIGDKHRGLVGAAGEAGLGTLADAVTERNKPQDLVGEKERRRRRAESHGGNRTESGNAGGVGPAAIHDRYEQHNNPELLKDYQEVPPPLRYVPYAPTHVRRPPPLPAPAETDSDTSRETQLDNCITDKTTYSLPSDGSPVTIRTKNRSSNDPGLSSNNKSQTSLLVEYFEGNKSGPPESRRPSVRVRVKPSSRGTSRSVSEHN